VKVGDLIRYSDDCNDRLGTHGLIVGAGVGVEIEPPIVSILWETGEIEDVFEDELSLVQESI
jgi:hypothetical protein